MNTVLNVENLTKRYEKFTLDHVSFSVPQGTIMGLIGENGAGKSTTIKAILDIIQKDEGSVTFWGQELASSNQLKEDIGVVFDSINFYERLTPVRVGKIAKATYKQWDEKLYRGYLDQFQLPDRLPIMKLSKGMKMKLSLAVALSHNSKLLIMDEVTSGLDPIMRDDVLDIFLEFVKDKEHTIILSSHITSDLEKIADNITFIHQGKLVFCKSKDELCSNYGVIHCDTMPNYIEKEDILTYRKGNNEFTFLVENKYKIKEKYKDVSVENATIDEIMLQYVKGENIK